MTDVFNELRLHMQNLPAVSTHSHHLQDEKFRGLTLKGLLDNTYLSWCGLKLEDSYESRKNYIDSLKYKSYFIWLQKALLDIYGDAAVLTPENWGKISEKISEANQDSKFHLGLLKNKCGYEKIIIDTYWNPGNNNGHPELFTPTFRINAFLVGYSKDARDDDGNSPYDFYEEDIRDIDSYIAYLTKIIKLKKKEGCVALKSAVAYDRGLDFTKVTREQAQKAFGRIGYVVTQQDIKNFGDYVFFHICKLAAELDLPLQCHTGTGSYVKTNAMQMFEVIRENPDTKFVLFHGGYPWIEDICALVNKFTNVYPDICWMPILDTSAAKRLLNNLVEICLTDRVCWGCDTWTSEESYGSLLAAQHVLAKVLSGKVMEDYFSLKDAKSISENILYNNAKKLYKI